MRYIFLLLALPLLFARAMVVSPLPSNISTNSSAPVRLPKMWAKSEMVFQGETFVLHFQAPNPQYLGVLDPNGHFYYVVFSASESVAQLTPLVDSHLFIYMDSLAISTQQLKADPYTYDVWENRLVFTQSGEYTFILGDNLQVDDPTTLFQVKINYRQTPRPMLQIAAVN